MYMSDQLCECYELPDQGRFLIGSEYRCNSVIEGSRVRDEDGDDIVFDEIKWLWYFR